MAVSALEKNETRQEGRGGRSAAVSCGVLRGVLLREDGVGGESRGRWEAGHTDIGGKR